MKNWIAIIASFLFSTNVLFSQSPDFTKLLGVNMNFVVDMIPASDGNFIIAGNDQSLTNVFVTSVNNEGEIVWSKFFNGEMLWYSRITQKSNGNILIPMGNFNPILLELNSLGDSLGSVTITETKRSYFGSVIELQDSLVFVSEIIFNDDPWYPWVDSSYLVKVSLGGNIVDKYLFKSKNIMDIIPNSENQLFTLVQPDSSINSYIAKYDINGVLLSTASCNTSNPYLNRLFKQNGSTCFAIGYTMEGSDMHGALSKFDNDCQIEYCNTYNPSYFSSVTNKIGTDNLYLLGENNGYCTINTANSLGNIISEYQISDSLTGNTVINKDSYVYMAGVNNYLTAPRAYFIRIHQDSIISGPIKNELQVFNVYPNPSSGFVVFEIERKDHEPQFGTKSISVEITDLEGNLLTELVIENGKAVWDARNVKSGLYIYKINLSDFSKQGKIVIKN